MFQLEFFQFQRLEQRYPVLQTNSLRPDQHFNFRAEYFWVQKVPMRTTRRMRLFIGFTITGFLIPNLNLGNENDLG